MASFLSSNEIVRRQNLQILNPKQKIWNYPNYPDMGSFPAAISIQNQLLRFGLKLRKFRLSYFYINNTYVPNNIPAPIFSFPADPTTMAKNISNLGTTTVIQGGTLGINSINYYFNINNTSNNNNWTSFVQHLPTGNYAPPIMPYSNVNQYYSDPYYWNYSTSYFTDYLKNQIGSSIATATGTSYLFDAKASTTGYKFYLEKSFFDAGYVLQLSQSLLNLYLFDNVNSSNSTYFFNLAWNMIPVTYNGVQCYTVTTKFIPDTWFPFDQLVLSTDLPLEPEMYYNNANYNFQSFDNIIISYDVNTDEPDLIYNFYKSDFAPEQGWVDFGTITDTQSENMSFKFQLRIKNNNTLINYPLAPGEQALLKFETMIFQK